MNKVDYICRLLRKSDSPTGFKLHVPIKEMHDFNLKEGDNVIMHFYPGGTIHITKPILDYQGKTHKVIRLLHGYYTFHFTSELFEQGPLVVDRRHSGEDILIIKEIPKYKK